MRPLLMLFVWMLVLAAAAAFAQPDTAGPAPAGTAPALGTVHADLQFCSMSVKHKSFATDESGLYVGLEGYVYAGRGWYLGAAAGGGGEFTILGPDEASFVPYEINAKHQFVLAPQVTAFAGAGLCYGKVDFTHDELFSNADDYEITQWVFGGQAIGSIDVRFGPLFAGMILKYQLTADADEIAARISPDEGWDYSNFRVGLEVGFHFGG